MRAFWYSQIALDSRLSVIRSNLCVCGARAAVSGRLLSAVLREQVPVDGLVLAHAARQGVGQLALRHVQARRTQVLRDVHHHDDPRQQHGSRTNRHATFYISVYL